ncbi:hypothetical protein EJ06DRAFT_506281 [Trichodelitschia bisporula]|uniref:Conserved oligomeric Golgi complex subunit 2 n=1 Tax=Trichodelitschia bisporula TaxID=703511 RepID=A0A6G1I526_9PEZI|nr:hypothetical protein EJ06DRAFT_506281 [Trichodelitschia bisporula]
MSAFYLNTPSNHSSSTTSDSDSDTDNLPYPQPLPRSAFLAPHFSPSGYLSTLHNRHQTLADLRSELRTRSQTLAKELLDLVNDEYQAFLTLGADLRGGEERVEEVRVGLLGFVKGVGAVRESVGRRTGVADGLVRERERVRRDKELARGLVEVHSRIGELEEGLAVGERSETDDSETDEDEDDEGLTSLARLQRLTQAYVSATQLVASLGEHPFLHSQAERLKTVRGTLLLDLGTALREALRGEGRGRVVRVMGLYATMEEGVEAVRVIGEVRAGRGR